MNLKKTSLGQYLGRFENLAFFCLFFAVCGYTGLDIYIRNYGPIRWKNKYIKIP